jgi:hypothetical protein
VGFYYLQERDGLTVGDLGKDGGKVACEGGGGVGLEGCGEEVGDEEGNVAEAAINRCEVEEEGGPLGGGWDGLFVSLYGG